MSLLCLWNVYLGTQYIASTRRHAHTHTYTVSFRIHSSIIWYFRPDAFKILYLCDQSDSVNLCVAQLRKTFGQSHIQADFFILKERGTRDTNEYHTIQSVEGTPVKLFTLALPMKNYM